MKKTLVAVLSVSTSVVTTGSAVVAAKNIDFSKLLKSLSQISGSYAKKLFSPENLERLKDLEGQFQGVHEDGKIEGSSSIETELSVSIDEVESDLTGEDLDKETDSGDHQIVDSPVLEATEPSVVEESEGGVQNLPDSEIGDGSSDLETKSDIEPKGGLGTDSDSGGSEEITELEDKTDDDSGTLEETVEVEEEKKHSVEEAETTPEDDQTLTDGSLDMGSIEPQPTIPVKEEQDTEDLVVENGVQEPGKSDEAEGSTTGDQLDKSSSCDKKVKSPTQPKAVGGDTVAEPEPTPELSNGGSETKVKSDLGGTLSGEFVDSEIAHFEDEKSTDLLDEKELDSGTDKDEGADSKDLENTQDFVEPETKQESTDLEAEDGLSTKGVPGSSTELAEDTDSDPVGSDSELEKGLDVSGKEDDEEEKLSGEDTKILEIPVQSETGETSPVEEVIVPDMTGPGQQETPSASDKSDDEIQQPEKTGTELAGTGKSRPSVDSELNDRLNNLQLAVPVDQGEETKDLAVEEGDAQEPKKSGEAGPVTDDRLDEGDANDGKATVPPVHKTFEGDAVVVPELTPELSNGDSGTKVETDLSDGSVEGGEIAEPDVKSGLEDDQLIVDEPAVDTDLSSAQDSEQPVVDVEEGTLEGSCGTNNNTGSDLDVLAEPTPTLQSTPVVAETPKSVDDKVQPLPEANGDDVSIGGTVDAQPQPKAEVAGEASGSDKDDVTKNGSDKKLDSAIEGVVTIEAPVVSTDSSPDAKNGIDANDALNDSVSVDKNEGAVIEQDLNSGDDSSSEDDQGSVVTHDVVSSHDETKSEEDLGKYLGGSGQETIDSGDQELGTTKETSDPNLDSSAGNQSNIEVGSAGGSERDLNSGEDKQTGTESVVLPKESSCEKRDIPSKEDSNHRIHSITEDISKKQLQDEDINTVATELISRLGEVVTLDEVVELTDVAKFSPSFDVEVPQQGSGDEKTLQTQDEQHISDDDDVIEIWKTVDPVESDPGTIQEPKNEAQPISGSSAPKVGEVGFSGAQSSRIMESSGHMQLEIHSDYLPVAYAIESDEMILTTGRNTVLDYTSHQHAPMYTFEIPKGSKEVLVSEEIPVTCEALSNDDISIEDLLMLTDNNELEDCTGVLPVEVPETVVEPQTSTDCSCPEVPTISSRSWSPVRQNTQPGNYQVNIRVITVDKSEFAKKMNLGKPIGAYESPRDYAFRWLTTMGIPGFF